MREIHDGSFARFDDQYMITQLRSAQQKLDQKDPLYLKIHYVLDRRPPTLLQIGLDQSRADAGRSDEILKPSKFVKRWPAGIKSARYALQPASLIGRATLGFSSAVWMRINHPDFYRQLGQEPNQITAAACSCSLAGSI